MASPPHIPRPEFGRVFSYGLLRDYRRRPAAPLDAMRAMNAAIVWQSRTGWRRLGVFGRIATMALLFPVQILTAWLRNAAAARRASGRGYLAQLGDLWRNATQRAITPSAYYKDGLYHAAAAGLDERLFPFHTYIGVCWRLAAERAPHLRHQLHDKVTFAQLAAARGLPAIPTLARVRAGADFVLPESEFLAKPNRGLQGRLIEIWRPEGSAYVGSNGVTLDAAGLRAHLLARTAVRGDLLLQPRLRNHPDFVVLAGAALSTTRINTMVSEAGEPEVVYAAFRASTAEHAPVDNYFAGGRLFPIDIKTGRLLRGIVIAANEREPRRTQFTDDSQRVGRVHPAWSKVSALAVRCHRAFPDLFIAGWDIAMTPDGPVVIEVNIPPGINVAQQFAEGGIDRSRMIELLDWHAARWLERNTPPDSRWRIASGH